MQTVTIQKFLIIVTKKFLLNFLIAFFRKISDIIRFKKKVTNSAKQKASNSLISANAQINFFSES